jgi:hypothetical protein
MTLKFNPNKNRPPPFQLCTARRANIDRYFGATKNLREGGLAPSFSAGLGSLSAGGTFKEDPKGCRAVVYLRTATLDSKAIFNC